MNLNRSTFFKFAAAAAVAAGALFAGSAANAGVSVGINLPGFAIGVANPPRLLRAGTDVFGPRPGLLQRATALLRAGTGLLPSVTGLLRRASGVLPAGARLLPRAWPRSRLLPRRLLTPV